MFNFYPHGLSMSLLGIADYAVYPANLPYAYTGSWFDTLPFD